MVTTLCLNPCFDRTVTVDGLHHGRTSRIQTSRTDPGGKGINVALAAMHLGMEVGCLWCAPEEGRRQMQRQLEDRSLSHTPIPVPGVLRTNLKVITPDGIATEINEPGAWMDEDSLKAVSEACSQITGSYVVMTGSLPAGCPEGTYAALMQKVHVPTILDTSGKELLRGLAARPLLIKPNVEELEKALQISIKGTGDIASAARQLMELGAQNVLVSMGGDGAMLFTPAHAYFASPLDVPVVSTVGAGDAMVAGVLHGLVVTGDLVQAFRYGVAAGSAAVGTKGTQPFALETWQALLEQVTLQEVDM